MLFCVADQSRYSTITLRDAADPSRQTQLQDNLTAIIIDDLNPIVRVAGLLQSNGKKYTLEGGGRDQSHGFAEWADGLHWRL